MSALVCGVAVESSRLDAIRTCDGCPSLRNSRQETFRVGWPVEPRRRRAVGTTMRTRHSGSTRSRCASRWAGRAPDGQRHMPKRDCPQGAVCAAPLCAGVAIGAGDEPFGSAIPEPAETSRAHPSSAAKRSSSTSADGRWPRSVVTAGAHTRWSAIYCAGTTSSVTIVETDGRPSDGDMRISNVRY